MEKKINKWFPSDFSLEYDTFLNDKGINAELFAILNELSIGEEGKTIVKKKMINKTNIAKQLEISRPTLNTKFNYLIEKKYIEILDNGDILLNSNKEKLHLSIPLSTIRFLNDVVKEEVYKTYIYLGVKYKWKKDNNEDYYLFTLKELGEHCGIQLKSNYGKNYEKLNNILIALKDFNLIDYSDTIIDKKPIKKLTFWTDKK